MRVTKTRGDEERRFQGIIFDLDGTLVDSYGAIAECFNHARVTLGEAPLSEAQVRRLVGHGLESLMEDAVGAARVDAAVRLFRERYDRICEARTTLLPEVADTLELLRARGLRMGVATNKPVRFAERILRALGVSPPISSIAGPGPGTPPKPDPAMVAQVLSELRVAAHAAVYVGDMDIDVKTARRAGLAVWVVPTGSSSRRVLEAAGADRVLDRFGDLGRLLPAPA